MKMERSKIARLDCKNMSLYFEKILFFKNNATSKNKSNDKKLILIRDILDKSTRIGKYLNYLAERHEKLVSTLRNQRNHRYIKITGQVKRRMLVGAGNPSPWEVGFTFSRNYGVPIIPASSIKGCFRHFLEDKGEDSKARKLFGTGGEESASEGNIIFLDAIPINSLRLGIDLINCHFQPYYSDTKCEKPPNDWYNPVPVYYLVIEEGIFRFDIFVIDNEVNIEEITEDFKTMLEEYGIGAKTSYGYGRFKKIEIQK